MDDKQKAKEAAKEPYVGGWSTQTPNDWFDAGFDAGWQAANGWRKIESEADEPSLQRPVADIEQAAIDDAMAVCGGPLLEFLIGDHDFPNAAESLRIVLALAARTAEIEKRVEELDERFNETLACFRRNIKMHEMSPIFTTGTDEEKAKHESYVAGLKRGYEILELSQAKED